MYLAARIITPPPACAVPPAFSAKASTFDFHSIPELCAKWDGFDKKTSTEGVTNRSIIFWAIQHNPEGADAVRKNTISYYLDLTINSVSANNIASAVVNAKGAGCVPSVLLNASVFSRSLA